MITLRLSDAQLSDLFFNYEHPHRDEVYKQYAAKKEAPSDEELREAAFKDAVDFIEAYDVAVEPIWLKNDFLKRV